MAPPDLVDVRAKHDRAERAHQEAGAETAKVGISEAKSSPAGKNVLEMAGGVEAEQEEVEHLEEVAARDAQNGLDLVQTSLSHLGFSSRGSRDPRGARASLKSHTTRLGAPDTIAEAGRVAPQRLARVYLARPFSCFKIPRGVAHG